jgi:hypothetical protein
MKKYNQLVKLNEEASIIKISILVVVLLSSCETTSSDTGRTFSHAGYTYNSKSSFPREMDQNLVHSLLNGRIEEAQDWIERGADVNAVGKSEASPLVMTILDKDYDGFRFLLENGANPNTQHEILWVPIYMVSNLPDPRFLRTILEYGADPNVPIKKDDRYLIYYFSTSAEMDRIELLMEYGADLDLYDSHLNHVVTTAVKLGNYIRARLFLERGSEAVKDGLVLDDILYHINSDLSRPRFLRSKKPYLMQLVSYLVYEKGLSVSEFEIPEELSHLLKDEWN